MSLSPSINRLVAIGLLAIFVATVWFAFFKPVLSSLSVDRQELALVRRSQHHLRYANAAIPPLQEELMRFRNSHTLDSIFLQGDSPTLLAAELQRRSNDIVTATGATLLSSLTAPVEREGGHVRIGLQLEMTATIGALQATLYRLETSTPLLTVDHLIIEAPENTPSQIETADPPVLAVHLHLSAYAESAS